MPDPIAGAVGELDQHPRGHQYLDVAVHVARRDLQSFGDERRVDHRMTDQQVGEPPDRGVPAGTDPVVPAVVDLAKLGDQRPAVGHRGERRRGHPVDDRSGIAPAVVLERGDVAVGVHQQPGRDRHGHVPGQGLVAQQGMQQGAAGAAVAVGNGWMVSNWACEHRRLHQDRQIVAVHEGDQVGDRRLHPIMVGRHEGGVVRAECAAPDPDLFLAPPPGDRGIDVLGQRPVHGQDRLAAQLFGQGDRGIHRADVGHDLVGVAPAGGMQLGLGDGPGRGGEVLDLRARRRFRAQQDRTEGRDLATSSASNRDISRDACSASAATACGRATVSAAISGSIAAR